MKNYKVISLDMFQTLVNVQERTGHVWRRILLEDYSDERALKLGALLLSHYHTQAGAIRDAGGFLRRITGGESEVCIVSDTDILMLPDFYKAYPIKLFCSEEYQSYKNDGLNRMFSEVIAFYGVKPEEIIHIGDFASDVLGAARAGMKSCWLNRSGAEWKHEVEPDYTVSDLEEFYAIL